MNIVFHHSEDDLRLKADETREALSAKLQEALKTPVMMQAYKDFFNEVVTHGEIESLCNRSVVSVLWANHKNIINERYDVIVRSSSYPSILYIDVHVSFITGSTPRTTVIDYDLQVTAK